MYLGRAEGGDRFLVGEWNDKAAGFVSYGGAGGARAVEQVWIGVPDLLDEFG